ncbi:MAG: apolipoprotein N-acyltransferase [Proteobacteria bacterium]|nr:apolipoprotein N-acyltransferase [Pseudomonadota bacterium]
MKAFSHYFLCLLAGAAMVPAMSPWNLWPFLFMGFSVFYILLSKAGKMRDAFIGGWLFGFGYFAAGLWWIANALLVPGNEFLWVWPLAIAGLPALLSFFPAIACLAVMRLAALKHYSGFFFFVAAFSLAEWLRGHLFTGYPWNSYGYAWGGWLPMAQSAAFGGLYFLTLLTVFWSALPGFLLVSENPKKIKYALAALAVIAAIANYASGEYRLRQPLPEPAKNFYIHIVQPNIPQADKWDGAKAGENLSQHLSLSFPHENETAETTTLIVWPETALSWRAMEHENAVTAIKDVLGLYKGKVYLVTGMLRYEPGPGGGEEGEKYFNSIAVFNRDLSMTAVYDKSHLVPFGEFIPLQKYVPFGPFVQFTGFATGPGPQTISLPDLPPFSPLVCYEIIFPGAVVGKTSGRPHLIVNVTNDAWYGDSPGPRQHFMQTRFRAIEEGLPIVRSANTGISGMIDAYGRAVATIGINSEGVLSYIMPAPAIRTTFYSIYGDTTFLLIIAVFLIIFATKKYHKC